LLHHLVVGPAQSAGGIVGRHDDDNAFSVKHSELLRSIAAVSKRKTRRQTTMQTWRTFSGAWRR
jgi:hypothetical protein